MKFSIPLFIVLILTSCVGFTSYKIINQGCNCEFYETKDSSEKISIRISGGYYNEVNYTKINLHILNESGDTLKFDPQNNFLVSNNYKFDQPLETMLTNIYPSDLCKIELNFIANYNSEKYNNQQKSSVDTLLLKIRGLKFIKDTTNVTLEDIKFIDS